MARGGGSVSGNQNTVPSQDASSPYYVHPGDGPSSVVVTPVLSGSNYLAWARSMRRALGSKNKFESVDGSIPIPDPFDPSYRAWSHCNMLIHSWLMNSVAESIGQSIVYLENAVDVWNDLKERFSQGDLIRISELQQEIYALRQGSSTVTEFYSELKVLWEELETYMHMPACSCPIKCSCAAMRNARHHHTLNYAIRFLTSLNENFSVVKSQILLMDPLPSMNRIFSMVIQHERQGNFAISDDSKALVNAVEYKRPQGRGRGSPQTTGFRQGNRVCTYCGRNGHTVETCYKKHGFPPHLQKHSGSMANNVSNDNYDQRESASMSGDERVTTPTFTHEQYEKLLNLIQNSSIGQQSFSAANQVSSSKVSQSTQSGHTPIENFKSGNIFISTSYNSFSIGSWIIDSGASDHICASLKCFDSYNEINPINIKLPNGHCTIAKYAGTVIFFLLVLALQMSFMCLTSP